ncbi:MAG: ankyrin repeat domain-containing protein [Verrucomicrobiota bacterium]
MTDPAEQFKTAFDADRAEDVRDLLAEYPSAGGLVRLPWGPFGTPPVVRVRSREMLEVLLEAGADINARSQWWAGGFGLLDFAAPDLAEYAVSRGAVVDIHAAARLGKTARVRELLAENPALVHARGGDGQTPLHFASTGEIAALLLESGADMNARDVDHESTPAQYMMRDRREVARFLVSRGAETDLLMAAGLGDVALVEKHLAADPGCLRMKVSERWFPKRNPHSGGTIYFWTLGGDKSAHAVARESGHGAVFDLLWSRTPPEQRLAVAAGLRDEPAVRELLAGDPGLAQKLAEADREALVSAAQGNDTAVVELMLSAGWPAGVLNATRASALHWASFHGNAGMVARLLREKPPVDGPDREFHSTPLGWAVYGSENGWHRESGDYPAVVRALITAGAAVPSGNPSGTPAIRAALAGGNEGI